MQIFQEQLRDIKKSLKVVPNANTIVLGKNTLARRNIYHFTFWWSHKEKRTSKYIYSDECAQRRCDQKNDKRIQLEKPFDGNTVNQGIKAIKVNVTKKKSKREIKREAKNTKINKKKFNKELEKTLKSKKALITKVGIKSSKAVIVKEIERLTRQLNAGEFDMPNVVGRVIKAFKNELVHRGSGIRRPVRMVSGGGTGLKK